MIPAASRAPLPSVIAQRARQFPDAAALHEVRFERGEPVATACSYADLFGMVVQAADRLSDAGVAAGDRVLLSVSRPPRFLAQFVAVQGLGAIPVALPTLADLPLPAYIDRIGAVALDAQPRAFAVDDAAAVAALPEEMRSRVSVITASSAAALTRTAVVPSGFTPERTMDEVAFLQYTSGSTGAPKGVVVLHANVVANLAATLEQGAFGPDDATYSWLPLFHDMGLIGGLLLGVYAGLPTYVATPRTFVTRPDSWLRAMSALRATVSFGPNFAYDLLARRVRDKTMAQLDLSRWRLAFNGAEPVAARTVRAFGERFAAKGLRASCMVPAYGLAECTLAVSFARPGEPARVDSIRREPLAMHGVAEPAAEGERDALLITGVGEPMPGHRVRILDPQSGRELPERQLGEIAVTGPSVTPGYHGAPLHPSRDQPLELRTGDLGYLAGGQLYVVDRLKDQLIIAGRKFAPSDIERAVAAIDGVRPDAVVAFCRPGAFGTDELCVAAATEPHASHRKDELSRAIASALHDLLGITPARVLLVRSQDLPKTSSGKLRRSACPQLFAAFETDGSRP